MGVPLRDHNGNVVNVPVGEVSFYLNRGYRYDTSDPRQRIPVLLPQYDQTGRRRGFREGTVQANEAEALFNADPRAMPITPVMAERLQEAYRQGADERIAEIWSQDAAGLPLLYSMADEMSFGGVSSAAAGMMAGFGGDSVDYEQASDALRLLEENNPIQSLIGRISGAVAGGFMGAGAVRGGMSAGRAASGLERASRAGGLLGALAGPAGLGGAAGEAATIGMRRLLTGMARRGTLSPGQASAVANALGAGAQGTVEGVAAGIMRANLENEELSTMQILSDGGLGALIGLGLGGAGEAISGVLRRGRVALPVVGGRAVVEEPRGIASRLVRERQLRASDIEDIYRNGGTLPTEAPTRGNYAINRMAAAFNATRPEHLDVVSNPVVQQLAHEAPEVLDNLAVDMAESHSRAVDDIARIRRTVDPDMDAASLTRIMDNDGVSHAATQARAIDFVERTRSAFREVLNPPPESVLRYAGKTSHVQRASELLDHLETVVRGIRGAAPARQVTPGEAYSALRQFRDQLSSRIRPNSRNPTMGMLLEVRNNVDALLKEEGLWKTVASHRKLAESLFDPIERDFREIMSELGVRDNSREGVYRKFTAGRFRQALNNTHKVGGRDIHEKTSRVFRRMEEDLPSLGPVLNRMGLGSVDHEVTSMVGRAQEHTLRLNKATAHVNAQNAVNTALDEANQGSGFKPEEFLLFPIVGLGLGAAIGGPAAGMVGALAGISMSFLQRPAAAYKRMYNIRTAMERWALRRSNGIATIERNVRNNNFRPTNAAANRRASVLPIVAATSDRERLSEFMKIRDHLQELYSDPMAFSEHLGVMTGGFGTISEGHQTQAQMTAFRAMEYLNSILPHGAMNPITNQYATRPSRTELDMFVAAIQGIDDPLSIYDDIASLRVNQSKVKAIGYVYPDLLGIVVGDMAALTASLESEQVAIPYSFRVMLSAFTLQPTDLTLTGQFINNTQSMYAQTRQQDQALRSMGTPRLPSHTMTEAQSVEGNL